MRLPLALAAAFAALLICPPAHDVGGRRLPERDHVGGEVAASRPYSPPTDGQVLRLFDPPAVPWGRGHRGVDLGADGTVRSPADGVVTFAGPVAGRGVVTVMHPDGLRSSFEPIVDAPEVGTAVARGDPLGSPQGGHCSQPCVHWGVRRGETYVDPLSLLGDATVVLLE